MDSTSSSSTFSLFRYTYLIEADRQNEVCDLTCHRPFHFCLENHLVCDLFARMRSLSLLPSLPPYKLQNLLPSSQLLRIKERRVEEDTSSRSLTPPPPHSHPPSILAPLPPYLLQDLLDSSGLFAVD